MPDEKLLQQRYAQARRQFLCERFLKAPGLGDVHQVAELVWLCAALGNGGELSGVEAFERCLAEAVAFAFRWFGLAASFPIQAWLAPSVYELRYMVGRECATNAAFAPGWHDGCAIVICQAPNLVDGNVRTRFPALLVHEIAHHILRKISGSSDHTMLRRELNQLPMWLEEGLCLAAQRDYAASAAPGRVEQSQRHSLCPVGPYSLRDLWNDLSALPDSQAAYRQAETLVQGLLGLYSKERLFRLIAQRGAAVEHARP